ncbi:MAG: Bug family tripartite tricarboxylate transporter substrate binding protein [Roseococcus sp.]
MKRRELIAAGAALGLAAPALAQGGWPQRGVRVIVPFAPGGSVDTMARLTAQKLQDRLGQPFVVENRAGGNGTVGGIAVAQSPADGHTLCFSASVQTLARLVMRNPGYDPLTDLDPIARVGQGPLLLIMAPQRPQTTLQEVVAAIRANPRDWSFATSALGAAGHLATVEFIRQIGVDVPIVSYRGTSPALADLFTDRVQLIFDPMLATLPPVRANRVKPIAITSARRSPAAPDVPTTAEGGMPSVDLQSWWGYWGPRNTPEEVKARMGEALRAIMAEPDVTERTTSLGIEALFEGAPQFAQFIRRDFERTQELLRIANVQPE